jgi:predicted flap endonuclease-1-like 5' DNA nuclease
MSELKLWHEPQDIENAYRIAEAVAQSGLAPAHLSKPQAAFVAMAMGAELGLSPMASLRAVYVVNGKPSMSADSMVGLVRMRGNVTQWDYDEMSEERVILTAARGDGKPLTLKWDVEMAKRAGLLSKGGPWSNYRRTMLKHRVDTEMCRALWPDIVQGLYDPDEVRSIDPTPSPVAQAVDLAQIPAITATVQQPAPGQAVVDALVEYTTTTTAEPPAPVETIPASDLDEVPGLGSTIISRCKSKGITTQAQLWEAIEAGNKPAGMKGEAVRWLEDKFAPEEESERDIIADLAERIERGKEHGVQPMDGIPEDLVNRGVYDSLEVAADSFAKTITHMGYNYTTATSEDLAIVWARLLGHAQ